MSNLWRKKMAKKFLMLFCALAMLFALTSLADREAIGANELTLRSDKLVVPGEWSTKAGSRAIVWDNGMDYTGLAASQDDASISLDPIVADDFIFDLAQVVNDVHWIGGYWNGPPDDGDFDWEIIFYNDYGDGTKPGTAIATYIFPNSNVNETWLSGTAGSSNFYSYSVNLPTPASFSAGTKYWISIQGIGAYAPQSGVAYHETIILHQSVFKSTYFEYDDWTDSEDVFGIAQDLCFQLTFTESCNWLPDDPHKMHFPQLPDPTGWAVNATAPVVLADDFMCMDTGWVKDIHFWGSWKNDVVGEITSFVLSLHADIPADPPQVPYSRPGVTLWEAEVTDFTVAAFDPPTMEGWYDPSTGEIIYDDHYAYFQYNVCLPEQIWFWQDSSTIYWLNISAVVADAQATQWGWKSTLDHWNDDAVWGLWGELDWVEMYEPAECDTIFNSFYIQVDPTGIFVAGAGEEAFGDGWYYYPFEEWWNIWFYDHPLDYERYKDGFIEFDVFPFDPQYPGYFEIAVNWATDQWTIDNPGVGPPLPGVNEALYIGRTTLFASEFYEGHYILDYIIPEYNPEWVSVDVRGFNYIIPEGIIAHACCPRTTPSLDLAFVITGEGPVVEEGACCYDPTGGPFDVACVITTQVDCETTLGGVYQGDGTVCGAPEACCLQDGTCIDADPLCCVNELGGTPQGPGTSCSPVEACCMADGSCVNLDPLCCADMGGTPQGPGTACTQTVACCMPDGSCIAVDPLCCDDMGGSPSPTGAQACLGDGNGNGVDDACEVLIGACCLEDGSCTELSGTDCFAIPGAVYKGDGTRCLGDNNANGINDACETWMPEDPHKMHFPQLPDHQGWAVNATAPVILADDWMCSETGWVKDIHFWGAYMFGGVGRVDRFILSIHSDVPAGVDQDYSHPGDLLWEFTTDYFSETPIDEQTPEGWYQPEAGFYAGDDHIGLYQYDIYLPEERWFAQEEGTIYWLNITAVFDDPTLDAYWGWKSSIEQWNDDATWALDGENFWIDLHYPPDFQQSLDLAFIITGEPGEECDCMPGDANNSLSYNILDVTTIINYLYKGGPAPTPYPLCSGDADCDCRINILDVTYIISYLYKGGSAPCDCPTWLLLCGPPLRK